MKNKKKILISFLTLSAVCALVIGLNVSNQTQSTAPEPDHTQVSAAESVQEPVVIYEAVFLDESEINEVFRTIRGEEAPYKLSPKEFHITVTFHPGVASYSLYGTKVIASGVSYKAGDVLDDKGEYTQNEGILVNLQSDNAEFNELTRSQSRVWHITGSYSDKPKYTGSLDYSDAVPVAFAVSGTFGAYMSDGSLRFTPQETAPYPYASSK